MQLDLHMHSTASDGQYTPAELMELCKAKGLEYVALTDHGTISGVKAAKSKAEEIGLNFISGIEISTREEGGEEVHIVGLGIDEDNPALVERTRQFMESRSNRGAVITDYLNSIGLEIDYEEIKAQAGGSIGRPHFADYLQKHGYVNSRQEAFDRYLNTPSFHKATDRKLPDPFEAIYLIHQAGGIAILAHPGLLKMGKVRQEEFIKKLKAAGLDGLEAFYSKYNSAQERYYLSLAKRFDLAISIGSDYHGEKVKPDVALGMEIDDSFIPKLACFRIISLY